MLERSQPRASGRPHYSVTLHKVSYRSKNRYPGAVRLAHIEVLVFIFFDEFPYCSLHFTLLLAMNRAPLFHAHSPAFAVI